MRRKLLALILPLALLAGGKLVFRGLKPRSIGPAVMGGRITAIASPRSKPNVLYIGTAGGGIWKSVDNGVTFRPIFDQYPQSIGSIAIDPNNPEVVWVGTGECNVRNSVSIGKGLYRSDDGGNTWKFMGFADSERIAKIVIDPRDSKTVYVCVLGHLWNDSKERGVYKTTDGGKTWKRILYVDEKTGCADLEIDPQEPDILYASMWQFRRLPWFFTSGGPGSGLYRTTDGGKTWKKLTKGLPTPPWGRIAIAIAPSRPQTLYATVEAKEKGGLYRSDDMGESWRLVNDSIFVKMRPFYFSNLVVSPDNHRVLYIAGITMLRSKDGGRSFDFIYGAVHSDIHPIWVDPTNPKRIIIGSDGGIYVSYNGGMTFRFINNLPVSQFYHVWYDMAYPYNVCGGLQDNGSWCGPSRKYGGSITNRDWENVGIGDGFYVFPHPKDPDIIYYSWQEGNLVRYNRKTREAKDIKPRPTDPSEPKYRFNWNAAVALSHHDPDTIYIGAQFLFRSRDRGETWEKISPDLTTNDPSKQRQEESGGITRDVTGAENHCTIVAISESPLDPNIIWVGTDDGNIQLTRDGGKTWVNLIKNVKGVPPNTWVSSIEASHFNPAVAYVTFDGHRTGDMKPYVYKTEDFGKTWVKLSTDEIEGYCHVIREDLKNPNLLFLGTEFGLYISIDGGRSWSRVREMPRVAVRDIAIHPREGDLILATHGRGILIIDDLTPLRALTPELLSKEAAILPSRPAIQRITSWSQEFPGSSEFIGENFTDGAYISYYLKRRHIFGTLKIEVYDQKGRLVKTLPASNSPGVNRIYWNMRMKPPKLPRTGGLMIFAPFGPMIDEGVYTVKLIKGKKVFEGKIEVKPDLLAAHSAEERRARKKLVMRLYNMLNDLSAFLNRLENIKKQAQVAAKKTRGKLRKRLENLASEAWKLHGEIINHQGMLAGEKLYEKLLGLYSSVISYGGKPSPYQVSYAKVLQARIEKKKAQARRIFQRVKEINRKLVKKGIAPIKY